MAVPDNVFDVLLFGLLCASPYLDRWLGGVHRYLVGAFTASLMAFIAYLSMWEMCRRSPLKQFRSQESLATALAASAVGLVFSLNQNNSPLVLLVLSIGFMMGALMAAIAVVSCVLDWKLASAEWWLAGVWVAVTAAGGGYVWQVLKVPHEAAWLAEGSMLVLGLMLIAKHPRRLAVVTGLVVTIVGSIVWGLLCGQVVLAASAQSLHWIWLAYAMALVLWILMRNFVLVPSTSQVPDGSGPGIPAVIWLGPIGLKLHGVLEGRKMEMADESAPAISGPTTDLKQPFGILFPGRLAERMALVVAAGTLVNHIVS